MTPRKIIGRLGIEPCAPNAYPSPGINAGVSRRFLMTQVNKIHLTERIQEEAVEELKQLMLPNAFRRLDLCG